MLVEEAMAFLAPTSGGLYCDATVGLGGHASAILRRSSPTGRLVAIDRDQDALARAGTNLASFGDRVVLVHARFGSLRSVLQGNGTPIYFGAKHVGLNHS